MFAYMIIVDYFPYPYATPSEYKWITQKYIILREEEICIHLVKNPHYKPRIGNNCF